MYKYIYQTDKQTPLRVYTLSITFKSW